MVFNTGQIPNLLSVIRIPLALISTYLALNPDFKSLLISFLIFLFAGFTDFVDGYLARKWKAISNFGKIMDPIADKVLNLGILIAFSISGYVPWWITLLICFREFALTIVRLFLLRKDIVIQAAKSGKIKTVLQFFFIVFVFIALILNSINIIPFENQYVQVLKEILMYSVVIITLYSGIEFFLKNKNLF